jgi:hypothetical protein
VDHLGLVEAVDGLGQCVEAPIFVNEPDVLFLVCKFG